MKVVPSLSITKEKSKLENALKNFINNNLSLLRFSITRDSLEDHEIFIKQAREIYYDLSGKNFELMLSVPYPKDKKRFVYLNNEDKAEFKKDQIIYITNNKNNLSNIYDTYFVDDNFIDKKHETAIIGDAELLIEFKEISHDHILAICLNDAIIEKGKAIASPSGFLKFTNEELTKKTLDIIKILKPNICVLSYIESRDDIITALNDIENYTGYRPRVMSKIESQKAMDNLDEIIDQSDLAVIARGCLGVNIGFENLVKAQNEIISKCNEYKKDAYIASNILRSLKKDNWPTRSDICDLSYMVEHGLHNFVITDGYSMTNKFNQWMYCFNKICDIYKPQN